MAVQRFKPKISTRGDYVYPELVVAPGPQVIGETADDSYEALYGREWLLVLNEDDNKLYLYQESATTDGEWTNVTANIPAFLFDDPLPSAVRRISFAFDQSARLIVAYEENQVIKVTRWDTTQNAYVQNVTFDGVDPTIFIDASVADPAGYPQNYQDMLDNDLKVIFKWIPDGIYHTSAIEDSDLVIFYLTPDRTGVRARVQRQLYQEVHVLHDFVGESILDKVLPLYRRYELLVSNATGNELAAMLISEVYFTELLVVVEVSEQLANTWDPEVIHSVVAVKVFEPEDELAVTWTPEAVHDISTVYEETITHSLSVTWGPENVRDVVEVYHEQVQDELAVTWTQELIEDRAEILNVTGEDELNVTWTPEAIRVQAV